MVEHTYENCHNITCRRKCQKDGWNMAIDEFAEKLKENIYPMSHGLGVHDIDRITESMKNSCISKTFREIDTDYIAEQLKEEQ